MTRLALVLAALLIAASAAAVEPDEVLDDPALEARARAISQDLRCLVCQNQSIDDSNAPLARDLRIIVRERLQAGDADDEVTAFLTDRYGDFVLLNPPIRPATYLLWFAPALLFIVGAGVIIAAARRRRAADAGKTLSQSDRARADALLRRDGDQSTS